jgi:hypothetical protein
MDGDEDRWWLIKEEMDPQNLRVLQAGIILSIGPTIPLTSVVDVHRDARRECA